ADDVDWRLVFRATAHNNQGFMSSFNNAKLPAPDPSERCDIVPSLTCKSNYRDIEAFNNWSDFTQALFAIYKGNDRVHYIIFDIKNTKIGQNWFRQDRIIESSWADLNYQSLSMAQNGVWVNGNYRRFTVVQTDRQPGFEFEAGWFMVVEPASENSGLTKFQKLLYKGQESSTRHSPQTFQPSYQDNRLHKLLKMMTKFVVLCLVATLCIQLSTQQAVDCTLPAVQGPCRMLLYRFFYNTATGACEQFEFGGCEGNSNNFVSVEDCKTACVAARK
ncbi:hypothetical protein Btru_008869, partial [Bulinus truncatus]